MTTEVAVEERQITITRNLDAAPDRLNPGIAHNRPSLQDGHPQRIVQEPGNIPGRDIDLLPATEDVDSLPHLAAGTTETTVELHIPLATITKTSTALDTANLQLAPSREKIRGRRLLLT